MATTSTKRKAAPRAKRTRKTKNHGASRGSAQALSSQHFAKLAGGPLFGAAFCICRMPVI
jgi:hypothetical protein